MLRISYSEVSRSGAKLDVRLKCEGCGRTWRLEVIGGIPGSEGAYYAIPAVRYIRESHRECAPDRIGPADEAWLREALK